ncbi:MAG: hypothetical protein WCK28_23965, partial [Burkholderiales bacterium]
APFVRMYLLTMAIESLEIAIVLVSMGHGRFVLKVDSIVLPVAIGTALVGAKLFGLVGAPVGAIVGAITAQIMLYRRFASLSGLPVRAVQEWGAMARVVLASGLSAASSMVAWAIPVPGGVVGRLIVAGLTFVVVYRVLLSLLGLGSKVRASLGAKLSRLLGFGGGDA